MDVGELPDSIANLDAGGVSELLAGPDLGQ